MPDPVSGLDPGAAGAAARLEAWLALQNAGALHPVQTRQALERAGTPEGALRLLRPRGASDASGLREQLRALVRCGARGLPLGAAHYPERLAILADAPALLWTRGRAELLGRPAVAIVGARAATAYGRSVARRLAGELAAAGLVIVSGLARGIDAEAHRATLAAGGAGVAVLGCGIDAVYPRAHGALRDRLAERGAIVSELPPGAPPLPYHFPLRNRLISGLSDAVVVVEARVRSGSLITAQHALEQGREVLAVPGPVDAPASVGPNRLLRSGARPVLEAGDVLDALGHARPTCPSASPERAALSAPARRILRALEHAPATRDELARRLAWAAPELARELVRLELEGRVVEDCDGRLRRVAPPREPRLCSPRP